MLVTIAAVSIAFIFGLFFFLDLIFNTKRNNGFFIRSLVVAITISLPKIIGIFVDKKEEINNVLCFTILIFVSMVALCLLFSYIFYRRFKSQYSKSIFLNECITFLNLLRYGYDGLIENIKKGIEKNERKLLEDQRSLIHVMQDLGEDISLFLITIYKLSFTEVDPKGYAYYVLNEFVNKFLSSQESRFTIRKLNNNNEMEVFLTTSEKRPPTNIPLNKVNMITQSLRYKKPLIYSRNTEYHYNTQKSIAHGVYNDYVTYVLISDSSGEKPLISVNLDVRSRETQRKMIALVDSSLFRMICEPIRYRFDEYIKKGGTI